MVAKRDAATDPAEKDKWQVEVEKAYDAMCAPDGYFRDSYNDGSLFWILGLSWWNDVGDMLDENGYLPIENAKKLLAMIEDRPVIRDKVASVHAEKALGDTADEWFEHWTKKRKRFMKFLQTSIDTNEPIRCSI
jgi:hypothetical protein